MNWLGLDIGGANLKAADGRAWTLVRPFPLWRRRHELANALAALLANAPPSNALAVTMTGELADCFTTKAEGVCAILDAVVAAAGGRTVWVYRTDGSWASPDQAAREPLLAAASNWHALARFAGRYAPDGSALLVDVGSTTCDVIPLVDGRPAAQGRMDPERLLTGELVYTGVQRSPICAVVDRLPWRGGSCPVAQELFATTWDAYLLLGDLPEEPQCTHTADGRPATKEAAYDRLARCICADRTMVSVDEALSLAAAIAEAQVRRIGRAVEEVVGRLPVPPRKAVLSGTGEFLARRVLERSQLAAGVLSLSERLGPAISCVAPAHALAVLAREEGIKSR